jgi:AhpC/TSA family
MEHDPGRLIRRKGLTRLAGFSSLAVGMLAVMSSAAILPLNVKVGDKAPDFALPSADGRTVRISDYAGHNVLIDFYRGHW